LKNRRPTCSSCHPQWPADEYGVSLLSFGTFCDWEMSGSVT
jgi:hypothetical protein